MTISMLFRRKLILGLIIAINFINAYGQPDPNAYHAVSRLDYYTGENQGEIAVFIPPGKETMAVTIDLVFEFDFLNRGFQVVPHGYSGVPFQLEKLREGDNEVTVSFYENNKWIDSRKVNVKIRKQVVNEVKTDRITGLMVCGELPFLAVGLEADLPADRAFLATMAREGLNLAALPAGEVATACKGSKKRFMEMCQSMGVRVNYNISEIARDPAKSGRDLEKEIVSFREHAALLTWTIAEYPAGRNIPSDSLSRLYQYVKGLDPYHPAALRVKTPDEALAYIGGADIFILDKFPAVTDTTAMRVLSLLDLSGKAVWSAPAEAYTAELAPGAIPGQDFRQRIYGDLCKGAAGFIRAGRGVNWPAPLPLELLELLPSLASGHPAPPLTMSENALASRIINKNGLFTIILANETLSSTDFSVKVNEIDLTIDANVIFEGRQVKMRDGAITDVVSGGGARVYVMDNRMKPDWKKDLHPGNMTMNPGFEEMSSPGRPLHCLAEEDPGNGSSWFADGLVHRQGDRSLRLVTSQKGKGVTISMQSKDFDPGTPYRVSVWAGKAPADGAGKEHPLAFRLSLGEHHHDFILSEEWTEYSFIIPAGDAKPGDSGRLLPSIELIGKGTAWFDVLQVYPEK